MHIQLESNIFIKIFKWFNYLNDASQVLSGVISGESNIYIYSQYIYIYAHKSLTIAFLIQGSTKRYLITNLAYTAFCILMLWRI